MRTKVVTSSPVCESSVVDLVDFCRVKGSPKRQRSLALPLHTQKKYEATTGPEQSAFEPTTIHSKVSDLPPPLSRNRRMHAEKNPLNHKLVVDRHGVLDSRSGKRVVRLNKLEYSQMSEQEQLRSMSSNGALAKDAATMSITWGCSVPPKKNGGGGGEEACGFNTV